MADYVNFQRVRVLPEFAEVDTIYFVQPNAGDFVRQYITGDDAIPVEIAAATAAQQLFEAGLIDVPTVVAMAAYLRGPAVTAGADAQAAAAEARAAAVSSAADVDAAIARLDAAISAVRVIDYVQINDEGFLIVYYTNGTQDNAGFVAQQVPAGAVTNSTGGYVRNASGGFVIGSVN